MDHLCRKKQSGFSLMELMIVMVVTIIILTSAFSLLRGAMITANANYHLTDATQGIRNSQEFITRDLLIAGDGVKGIANIWLTTSFVTKYLTVRSAAEIDSGATGFANVGMIISDNDIPDATAVPDSELSSVIKGSTDRITTLVTDRNFEPIAVSGSYSTATEIVVTISGTRPDLEAGAIYFASSGGTGTFFVLSEISHGTNDVLTIRDGDHFGINYVGGTGGLNILGATGQPINISRVNIVQYYVDTEKTFRRVFGSPGNNG